MFDDEPDDEPSGSGVPLPPDDRLWRHPSEMGTATAFAPVAAGAAAPRSLWVVAVVAGLAGASVAVTALAVTGSLSPRVVEQPERSSATLRATTVSVAASPKTVKAIATEAAAVVAQVQVTLAAGRRVGSAVSTRADGALLTSATLVADAKRISVTLPDGRTLDAAVAGRDAGTGLAVVRVRATGMAVAEPPPNSAEPGDLAVTVAGRSAGEREPSVTSGVVSAVGRALPAATGRMAGMIETDRPVPGRADGGALVGADGSVTGICLAVDGAGDGELMGYAVPIDVATAVAADLLAYGRVKRAWLGVEADDLPSVEAGRLGVAGGVAVTGVAPASPAAAAGMRAGDVLTEADGAPVASMDALWATLANYRPGQRVAFVVLRDGDPVELTATLAERR